MQGHPGGEAHTRKLLELSGLPAGSRWLDMGAGDGGAVRLLERLGFRASGIDLAPRGENVDPGDFLSAPYASESFDGILSQCSFYASGDVPGALQEAGRMLRPGGKLVFSDVTEDATLLLYQVLQAGFQVVHWENLTAQWREYYFEALWREEDVCLPGGKKYSYVLLVCERM